MFLTPRFFLLSSILSVVILAVTSFARADYQRRVVLRPGDTYSISDSFSGNLLIQCGREYPDYPGTPSCSSFDFDHRVQELILRRDRLAQGECAYRRVDGFLRCEGLLDRFEVQAQKDRFNRDFQEIRLVAESICRSRGCQQMEVSRVLRDYDAFLSSVQFSRIVFERFQSIPFIDFPQNYRLNCSY